MVRGNPDIHSTFDDFAESYDSALDRGLAVTGEERSYFARGRMQMLKSSLRKLGFHAQAAMEFGCGTGANIPFLFEIIEAESVLGIDRSKKSIDAARSNVPLASFSMPSDYLPIASLDLVFCNGVFHHIHPAERLAAAEYVRDCLRPGGIFAFWENNPWNPGTRYVMKRISFDRDAVTLSSIKGRQLLSAAGFHVLDVAYMFIFPHALRGLRGLELPLSRLPLGGQYQLLAMK